MTKDKRQQRTTSTTERDVDVEGTSRPVDAEQHDAGDDRRQREGEVDDCRDDAGFQHEAIPEVSCHAINCAERSVFTRPTADESTEQISAKADRREGLRVGDFCAPKVAEIPPVKALEEQRRAAGWSTSSDK